MKRIKNQNRPKQILDTLLAQVYLKNRVQLDTSLHVDRNPKSFPKKRDIAYTDGETICISPKMYSLEIENQIAVLAHEVAHCYLIALGDTDHTEDDADNMVYHLFGITINYDDDDIQTTHPTGKIRPRYLPQ